MESQEGMQYVDLSRLAQIAQIEAQVQQIQAAFLSSEDGHKDLQRFIGEKNYDWQHIAGLDAVDKSSENENLRTKSHQLVNTRKQTLEQAKHEQQHITSVSSQNLHKVNHLKQKHQQLSEQLNNPFVIDSQELQNLLKNLAEIKASIENESRKTNDLAGQLQNCESEVRRLSEELLQENEKIKGACENQVNGSKREREIQLKLNAELEHLQKQLRLLSEEYLKAQEDHRTQNNCHSQRKQALQEQKTKEQKISQSLKNTQQHLKAQLQQENHASKAIVDNDKQLNLSISISENVLEQKITDNGELNNKIKQVKGEIEKEQLRIKDQKLNTKKKNFKAQISDANKDNQALVKDLERYNTIFKNTQELRHKYVSRQSLQMLEKELKRHQLKSGPNLQGKTVEQNKLLKENQALKQYINRLNRLNKQSQVKEEKILKQVKAKGQIVSAEKQAFDKNTTLVNNKLKEYFKEYPNHEKDLQLKKLQEKKDKMEEKKKKAQEASKKRENEVDKKKKSKPEQDSDLIIIQDETAKGFQQNYYQSQPQNLYYQLAIGALAFLIMYVVFFN